MLKTLSVEDFAKSFGTTSDDLPEGCLELIRDGNFDYKEVAGEARDKVILQVLDKIATDLQIVGAEERKAVWERGWRENLDDFVESNHDLNKLVPRFLRPDQAVRLNGKYVLPSNPKFELDFYEVFRHWLFHKYFSHYQNIYEFGCGTGFNLVTLSQLFPEKRLYGLDFVPSAANLVNEIAKSKGANLSGHLFDMKNPDQDFELAPDSLLFTSGAIEQLASCIENFIQYILKQKPALVVHIEPTLELYDTSRLEDYLAAWFHRKRGYTQGLLSRLQKLEKESKVEIQKIKRLYFGSLFMEGYTCYVWKPL